MLVDGGDLEEPIADEIRGIVDGHWVMERRLAERGQYPAVQALTSVSRVAPQILARDALEARLGEAQSAGLTWKPLNTVAVDEDQAGTLIKLFDTLDDNDDVQLVSANFDIAEDIMAKLTT